MFSTLFPKPSGPVALLASKEFKTEKTAGGLTFIHVPSSRQSVSLSLSAATSGSNGWSVKSSVDCSAKYAFKRVALERSDV